MSMSPIMWGALVIMVIAGVALAWRPAAPSPLSKRRKSALDKAADQVNQGRLGKYVEDQVGGASSITGMRLLVIFVSVGLCALLLLFRIFGLLTPLVAGGVAFLVGYLYVQAEARKRKLRLEEQTLRLATVLAAALKAQNPTGTYLQRTRRFLQEMKGPLDEDLGAALDTIFAKGDVQDVLFALQQETRSDILRRLLGRFMLIEKKSLTVPSQQKIFDRFAETANAKNRLAAAIRVETSLVRGSQFAVIALVPLMLLVKFGMRGPIMAQYVATSFGQTMLGGGFLLLVAMVFINLRMMKRAEEAIDQ